MTGHNAFGRGGCGPLGGVTAVEGRRYRRCSSPYWLVPPMLAALIALGAGRLGRLGLDQLLEH